MYDKFKMYGNLKSGQKIRADASAWTHPFPGNKDNDG